jgi:hypothetical protein
MLEQGGVESTAIMAKDISQEGSAWDMLEMVVVQNAETHDS